MTRVTRKLPRKGVYQPSTHLAAVVLVLIVFVSAGAVLLLTATDERQDTEALLDELAASRALWAGRRPDAFRYVVERDCACPAEDSAAYIATERFGVQSAEFRLPVESGSGEFLSAPPRPIWIDDVFALVEAALQAEEAVTVRYDANRGYPTYAAIGDDADAGVIGRRYSVRDFEILRD